MPPEDLDFTESPRRHPVPPGAVMAAAVIAFGVLLLLDRNGVLDAWSILRYWPLALIGVGVVKLLGARSCSRVTGIILIVVGVLNSGWSISYQLWSNLWPIMIIVVGAVLLWRAVAPGRASDVDPVMESSWLHEFTMFGGGERKLATPAFEGGDAFAMFGGFEIDLRKSAMKGNRAVIDANCMFGGIVIKVPEDWNVTLRGLGIFGGYSDSTRHPRSGEVPFAKHLVVRGMAMFGGVEVKN
jgi:predicted membrane protein